MELCAFPLQAAYPGVPDSIRRTQPVTTQWIEAVRDAGHGPRERRPEPHSFRELDVTG